MRRLFRFMILTLCLMFLGGSPLVFANEEGTQGHQAKVIDLRPEKTQSLEYVFALTRNLDNSSTPTAVKPFLYILTIPLDIVTLPFAFLVDAANADS